MKQPNSLFDDLLPAEAVPVVKAKKRAAAVKPVKATKRKASSTSFTTTAQALSKYALQDKGGFISQEFQDFGYRLAVTLDDMEHKSLYIKLAKSIDRSILEQALTFVSDATARNKAKLFMWKLKQLRGAPSNE